MDSEDWDRDEGHALLKRTKSMDFAHSQLARLEAKYSGNVDLELKEKTCIALTAKLRDGDVSEALHTLYAANTVVGVFEEVFDDSMSLKTIVVVHSMLADPEPGLQTMKPGLGDGSRVSGKEDSQAQINDQQLQEVLELLPQLVQLGTSHDSVACFTGFSIGGAVATILAWAWSQPTELITFGSPKVGDREFAFETLDNASNVLRYRMGDDPVPLLLPHPEKTSLMTLICGTNRAIDMYRHVGPELHVWMDEAGGHRETVKKRPKQATLDSIDFEDGIDFHSIEAYEAIFQNTLVDE